MNIFSNKTKYTNRIERLFGKFIPLDLGSVPSVVESETKSANLLSTNSSTLDSLEHIDDTDDDCMESWYALVLNVSHFLLLTFQWQLGRLHKMLQTMQDSNECGFMSEICFSRSNLIISLYAVAFAYLHNLDVNNVNINDNQN